MWIAIAVVVVVFVAIAVVYWPRAQKIAEVPAATPPVPPPTQAAPPSLPPRALPQLEEEEREPESEEELVPEADFDEEADDETGVNFFILVSAAGRSDAGKVRAHNEDSYLVMDDHGVFVVADGMGGHSGGEVASKIVVETIEKTFKEREFRGARRVTRYRRANEVVRAIERANEEVRARAKADPSLHDMGSTVVVARFSPGRERVYVANVGDSRAYRVRKGSMEQLTRDHTLAVEAGAKGKIGAQLTRALGASRRVRPDVRVEDARPGDTYLLCSDGLTKMMGDNEICECIVGNDIKLAAQLLVAYANERGGEDNTTVILVRVDEGRRIGTPFAGMPAFKG